MAFSKCPVRRFNETNDNNPPPGAYDPKFLTDVSISSSTKGPTFSPLKSQPSGELTTSRSRPSSPSPANSTLRIRSSSFQRSKSNVSEEGSRRNTSQPPLNRTWNSIAFPLIALPVRRREEKSDTAAGGSVDNHVKSDLISTEIEYPDKDNVSTASDANEQICAVKIRSSKSTVLEIHELHQRIDELEKLIRDGQEISKLHEKEKKTHENMIRLLKLQVKKDEQDKSDWESTEETLTNTIQVLQSSEGQLKDLLENLKTKYKELLDKNHYLQTSVELLEQKKALVEATQRQHEKAILQMQDNLLQSEEKCRLLHIDFDKTNRVSEETIGAYKSAKQKWANKETEYLEKINSLKIQLKESALLEMINVDAEESFNQAMEVGVKRHRKSESASQKTDDKIQALKRQWADEKRNLQSTIENLEGKIKFLEKSSQAFEEKASGIIEQIAGTREYNDKLRMEINHLNDPQSQDQDQTLHLAEIYSSLSSTYADSLGLDSITPPDDDMSLSENESAHYVFGSNLDYPPSLDAKINIKEKLKEFKIFEKELEKNAQERSKKKEKTEHYISTLENEKKEMLEFISNFKTEMAADAPPTNPLDSNNNNVRESDSNKMKVSLSTNKTLALCQVDESETGEKVSSNENGKDDCEVSYIFYNGKPKKTNSVNSERDQISSTLVHATTSEPTSKDQIHKRTHRDRTRTLIPSSTRRRKENKFGNACSFNLCSFLDDVPEEDDNAN